MFCQSISSGYYREVIQTWINYSESLGERVDTTQYISSYADS